MTARALQASARRRRCGPCSRCGARLPESPWICGFKLWIFLQHDGPNHLTGRDCRRVAFLPRTMRRWRFTASLALFPAFPRSSSPPFPGLAPPFLGPLHRISLAFHRLSLTLPPPFPGLLYRLFSTFHRLSLTVSIVCRSRLCRKNMRCASGRSREGATGVTPLG